MAPACCGSLGAVPAGQPCIDGDSSHLLTILRLRHLVQGGVHIVKADKAAELAKKMLGA